MIGQIVSKKRVADHGEVFTSQREVNAMLDLVKHETQRIDSRFLEPACGTGNFLAEILARKLGVVESRYRQSPVELERYTLLAVTSIYGIDLLLDNVTQCRRRLVNIGEMRLIFATGTLVWRPGWRKRVGASMAGVHDKFLAMKDPTAKLKRYIVTRFRLPAEETPELALASQH